MRSSRRAASLPGSANMTSRSGRSRCGSSASVTSSRARAKVAWRAWSCRPAPGRWLPCPVKRRATRRPCAARPVTSRGAEVRPSARSPSAPASSSVSRPRTTARCSKAVRERARARPTAAGSTGATAVSVTWARSRRAWSRRAASVRPERTQALPAGDGTGAPASGVPASGVVSGALSRIRWALVPLAPKEDTPARRGASSRSGHAAGSASRETAPADQSTRDEGCATCRVRGSRPWRMARTVLMTPATPAAACVWPMLDFSEPSSSGRPAGRPWPYVARRACASMGSPRRVPVPWASTASIWSGPSPAPSSAWRMTRCCARPLGAVRPLLAPSWLTAEPRTTASTGWPCSRASESRSRSNMPAPSAKLVPSAASENALQRPSAARPRSRAKSTKRSGVASTVAPPASAMSHSRRRSASAARCTATSDDEQAVSTVTAGPSRPRV